MRSGEGSVAEKETYLMQFTRLAGALESVISMSASHFCKGLFLVKFIEGSRTPIKIAMLVG